MQQEQDIHEYAAHQHPEQQQNYQMTARHQLEQQQQQQQRQQQKQQEAHTMAMEQQKTETLSGGADDMIYSDSVPLPKSQKVASYVAS